MVGEVVWGAGRRPRVGGMPTSASERWTATVTIVLTLIGWSSIPLFLKHFSGLLDPWTTNGWRYGFSALVWLPVIGWHVARSTLPRGIWRAALVPSVFNGLGQIAFGLAPWYVDPGLMTFSLRIQIVFVTIGAALLFAAERRVIRNPLFIAGLCLVVGGTLTAVYFRPGGLGGGTGLGIGLAIGSGLLYAGYALSVRQWMQGMAPLLAFAVVSQLTAVIVVLPMFWLGDRGGLAALDLPREQFGLLLLSAIIGIGIGHTLYFFSIARLGVAVASGVVQLQPIIVSVLSVRIFGERLTPIQWAAGGCAIVGAGVLLWAQHRVHARRAEA